MEQRFNCPSCGAPVGFKSAASVMVVCDYCHTALLRDAQQVAQIGKAAVALEDYSPVRIGMSGAWGSRAFDVIGRVQVRYERGMWNEWVLLFADGGTGWLSDAQGFYAITEAKPASQRVPPFDQWRPGLGLAYGGTQWVASDVRTARAVGAEGELPFKLGEAWEAKVVDLRADRRFLTLDWSDGETPVVYEGTAVDFAALRPQLARSDDEIRDKAGRYPGKVDALTCPNCGSSIRYVPGLTPRLSCPSCGAQIEPTPERSAVLRVLAHHDETAYTYPLGAAAKLDGRDHTLIGAMTRVTVDDDAARWNEYLLYAPNVGFTWLIETDDGWQRGQVLDDWPKQLGGGVVERASLRYSRTESYPARVVRAVGAFNWRVEAGDVMQVNEFVAGIETLSAESDAHELGWTLSRRVDAGEVARWFGQKPAAAPASSAPASVSLRGVAIVATIALVLMNIVPIASEGDDAILYSIIAGVALWLPVRWFGDRDDRALLGQRTDDD